MSMLDVWPVLLFLNFSGTNMHTQLRNMIYFESEV